MQIFRKIIGAVVLISGVFFVIMNIIGKVNNTVRILAVGVMFIGGGIWFLMQKEDFKNPKAAPQKPKKDISQKPFANEDEMIEYIRTNVLISNTCATSRYNNKNINFDGLVQDLCDFYEGHFKGSKPTRIRFDNIVSISNDECIVVLIKGVNNIMVKVHAPFYASEVKTGLGGAALTALGNMTEDELIGGGSFGRINPAVALRKASLRERDTTVETLKQQGHRLEELIAKHIDDHIRNNKSSQSESLDMLYMRNLRNWRT